MKPIKFKEQTGTLFGRWDIKPLPIFEADGKIVSCWRLSIKEKIKALLFGKIWLIVKSEKTHPPISMICDKSGFE